MKRINTRADLVRLAEELELGADWREPDESGVTAKVHGVSFDNAGFWPADELRGKAPLEQHVILKKDGEPVAAVNLATLFAWATGYDN